MRADPSDSPRRMTRRDRKLAVGFTIAAALVASLVYLAEQHEWLGKKTTARPAFDHEQPTPIQSSPSSEDISWHSVEQQNQIDMDKQAERQTVFNDENYKPRPIVNSVPPPQITPQQPRAHRRPVTAGLNGQRATTISWTTARRKTSHYVVRYRWTNFMINRKDFCVLDFAHKKGSIKYRECRKAAKVYLREECRAGRNKAQEMRRMYCLADNAFRH